MCTSAVLYSNKNYVLAEGIRFICRENRVTLSYSLDLANLLYNIINSKPEIVFYDTETFDFNYEQYNIFANSKLFHVPKIVLLTKTPDAFDFKNINLPVVNSNFFADEIVNILKTTKEKTIAVLSDEAVEKIKEKTSKILNDIGITSKFLGYEYIKEAVVYIKQDKRLLQSFNKKLYPLLATKTNSTVHNIERNIRNAIHTASIKSKNKRLLDDINCRNSLMNTSLIPTNKQLITWVVEQV